MLHKINLHCAINLSQSTNKIQNYRLQVGGLRVHSYVGEKSDSLHNSHRCSLYYLRGQAIENSPNLSFQRSGFVKRTLTRSSPRSPGDSLCVSIEDHATYNRREMPWPRAAHESVAGAGQIQGLGNFSALPPQKLEHGEFVAGPV